MEKIIFKTYGYYSEKELKEWEQDIKNDYPDCEDINGIINDDIQFTFDAEKHNLNKELNNNIIAIASMGLWNGRKTGYKILDNNLNEIMKSFSCDEFKIFYDGYNVKFEGYHHDGTNYILFREIKNMDNIDNFTNLIYNQKGYSNSQLNYYTKSLKSYVKNIYGW